MAGQKAIAIIPARMGSTRFPGKALASETGKPMVVHVCERAAMAEAVANVVVATDSQEIRKAVEAHGFDAVMTSNTHPNGTSRLAEAVKTMGLNRRQPVVNVQGDEPEIAPELIDAVLVPFEKHPDKPVLDVPCTVASPLRSLEDLANPNIVKVVTRVVDNDFGLTDALYFSRAPIPYDRDKTGAAIPLRHVGLYAYSVGMLNRIQALTPTPLEQTEQLEQLRWLEHGLPIAVAIRQSHHQGIDTPEQYAAFVERYRTRAGA